MSELIDTRIYFCLRAKNSILRNQGNRFYILDHKNKESIRYYFIIGNLTIFACKNNIYDDVCLILEKLGLPIISKDEFSLIQKKMKDYCRFRLKTKPIFSPPSKTNLLDGYLTESLKIYKGYIRSA